jgi:hypothetical protein
MKYLVALLLFVCTIEVAPCEAEVIKLSLEEMIRSSRLIIAGTVVGTVVDISEAESRFRSESAGAVAEIEIETVVIGKYEKKRINVRYFPPLSIESHFDFGETCLLFLKSNTVANGYAGVVLIRGDNVSPIGIEGEASPQDLREFIEKIRRMGR